MIHDLQTNVKGVRTVALVGYIIPNAGRKQIMTACNVHVLGRRSSSDEVRLFPTKHHSREVQ